MEEIFFSITYPPIPITKVGPVFLSLHGVFAAIGFYFGASHALKLSEQDGANSILFSEALSWAIFGAILGARFFTIPAQWYANPGYGLSDVFTLAGSYSIMGGMAGGIIAAYLKISIFNKEDFKQIWRLRCHRINTRDCYWKNWRSGYCRTPRKRNQLLFRL